MKCSLHGILWLVYTTWPTRTMYSRGTHSRSVNTVVYIVDPYLSCLSFCLFFCLVHLVIIYVLLYATLHLYYLVMFRTVSWVISKWNMNKRFGLGLMASHLFIYFLSSPKAPKGSVWKRQASKFCALAKCVSTSPSLHTRSGKVCRHVCFWRRVVLTDIILAGIDRVRKSCSKWFWLEYNTSEALDHWVQ